MINLWKNKEQRIVDPALYSKTAKELSEKFAKECEQTGGKSNGRSQIRKFYDEVLRIEMTAKSRQGAWENILPLVHMLPAKAAYAEGRKLVSTNFAEFIRECVAQVEYPEDLSVFSSLFEAFIGFYRSDCPVN